MEEKFIEIDYETIGVKELRNLNDLSELNRVLTHEEFIKIVKVYSDVVERLSKKL